MPYGEFTYSGCACAGSGAATVIGLGPSGVPQPITGGLKLTGQVGKQDIGALYVRTQESGDGRLYASGSATLGAYYCGVDSFLGLQYAALRIADYRYYISGNLLASLGLQMQKVAVGWEIVARLHHDPRASVEDSKRRIDEMMQGADYAEGVAALRERRPPRVTGCRTLRRMSAISSSIVLSKLRSQGEPHTEVAWSISSSQSLPWRRTVVRRPREWYGSPSRMASGSYALGAET